MNPLPIRTNCSSGSWSTTIALCRRTCLSVHFVPLARSLVTSAMIASETFISLPLTVVLPFCKFCKNSSVISSWNPCNLFRYCIHPARSRITRAWSDTMSTVGSFWIALPPMAAMFLWLDRLHGLLLLFHKLEQQQRSLKQLIGLLFNPKNEP